MLSALTTVFSRPPYVALAAFVVVALSLFVAWFPNRDLLAFALSSGTISFWKLVAQSHQFFAVNATPSSAVITGTVILLSGINIAMLVYYLKRHVTSERGVGIGVAGTLVGILGVGCAACGSIVLSSIFGLSAAAGFLGFLPFGGVELGVLGALTLAVSIVLLGKKITNPALCNINT